MDSHDGPGAADAPADAAADTAADVVAGAAAHEAFLAAVARAVRARRRVLRMDQRALAARAGVSKSTVARLERAEGIVAIGSMRRVLAEAGLALVLTHEDGAPWQEDGALRTDVLRVVDRAGRSFPAHLPTAPRDSLQSWDFVRDRRWGSRRRTPWRYDRWSDDVDAFAEEMRADEQSREEEDVTEAPDS